MSKTMKTLAAMALSLTLLAGNAYAGSVNETDGIAIKGYDPVAYFTDHKPVKGTQAHMFVYEGVTYRFASEAHRKAFAADPSKYAPQFGGFCAYGTAAGHKADVDPTAFTVVDGKPYLNYNAKVRDTWRKDGPANIQKAETAWPSVSQQTEVIH
jgi:YHS domain-containing protein